MWLMKCIVFIENMMKFIWIKKIFNIIYLKNLDLNFFRNLLYLYLLFYYISDYVITYWILDVFLWNLFFDYNFLIFWECNKSGFNILKWFYILSIRIIIKKFVRRCMFIFFVFVVVFWLFCILGMVFFGW